MLHRFRSTLLLCTLILAAPGIMYGHVGTSRSFKKFGPTVKLEIINGAKLSDTVTIVAKATADNDADVEKVEFSIDGKLKYTDSSVPYSYDWNTLEDTEGDHTISATVFDTKGASASTKITVTVDNGLSLGAAALATTAVESAKAKDFDKAVNYARRSLKLDPSNINAIYAIALSHRSKGEFDKGSALLSTLKLPDSDIDVRMELIYQLIQMGDNSPNTEDFLKLSSQATDVYKAVTAAKVASAKGSQAEAAEKSVIMADAYIAARSWEQALRELDKVGSLDVAPVKVINRTILASLSSGRIKEAEVILTQMNRAKKGDDVTQTMWGYYYMLTHQFTKASDAIKPLVDKNLFPALVLDTYLNLTTGKPAKARQSAAKAIEIAPDSTDSQMLVAYTERDPIASRHAFLNALAFTPNLPEAYALRGLQTTNTTDSRKFETANPLVEYAYKLDPKNSYALMAKAICLLAQKRSLEAQPVVLSLLEVDPTAADSHIVAAILYTQLDKTIKVTEHMKKANSIDPERWGDLFVPKPEAFGTRVLKYRFSPLLSPALLYLTAKEQ